LAPSERSALRDAAGEKEPNDEVKDRVMNVSSKSWAYGSGFIPALGLEIDVRIAATC
jgi:hypothetical protein